MNTTTLQQAHHIFLLFCWFSKAFSARFFSSCSSLFSACGPSFTVYTAMMSKFRHWRVESQLSANRAIIAAQFSSFLRLLLGFLDFTHLPLLCGGCCSCCDSCGGGGWRVHKGCRSRVGVGWSLDDTACGKSHCRDVSFTLLQTNHNLPVLLKAICSDSLQMNVGDL